MKTYLLKCRVELRRGLSALGRRRVGASRGWTESGAAGSSARNSYRPLMERLDEALTEGGWLPASARQLV